MRFGAGGGPARDLLTLGTGVGSACSSTGLVPNTEFGQMEIRGRDAERRSASAARVRRGLSWKAWAPDLDEHLTAIDKLISPNLIILGGGVSKNADKFMPRLTVRCTGRRRPSSETTPGSSAPRSLWPRALADASTTFDDLHGVAHRRPGYVRALAVAEDFIDAMGSASDAAEGTAG